MLKLMGLLDIFAAILLLAAGFKLEVPLGMVILVSALLILKAAPFLPDFGSILDIILGILLLLSSFLSIPPIILFIASGVLGLKGIISLF